MTTCSVNMLFMTRLKLFPFLGRIGTANGLEQRLLLHDVRAVECDVRVAA